MIALPLSVLALAAGVYLLVKVKREYLGGIFEVLSWLVILASLVSLGYTGFKALNHCCGSKCGSEKCTVEKEGMIKKEGSCHGGTETCSGKGCHMEGDSCVMEQNACEAMMGKEACDALVKERGRCIMSKEECNAKCSKKGACTGEKKECCAKKDAAACPHVAAGCKGDCGGKCGGECKGACTNEKKLCCKK
jgi:hypothetical protein